MRARYVRCVRGRSVGLAGRRRCASRTHVARPTTNSSLFTFCSKDDTLFCCGTSTWCAAVSGAAAAEVTWGRQSRRNGKAKMHFLLFFFSFCSAAGGRVLLRHSRCAVAAVVAAGWRRRAPSPRPSEPSQKERKKKKQKKSRKSHHLFFAFSPASPVLLACADGRQRGACDDVSADDDRVGGVELRWALARLGEFSLVPLAAGEFQGWSVREGSVLTLHLHPAAAWLCSTALRRPQGGVRVRRPAEIAELQLSDLDTVPRSCRCVCKNARHLHEAGAHARSARQRAPRRHPRPFRP